ncbi:MAG: MobC family plasmid mobilization relaxosome protein [Lachnospiraceae bacterium]|nr:MobC family plasmid mobilization relaxosome protein [Lachnospiraceae bacterium]
MEMREYNYTPGKISGNLNQIARRMNATAGFYSTYF